MAELWHYTRDGKQMDPVPFAELQRLARLGELRLNDLVWNEALTDWARAKSVPDLFPSLGIIAPDNSPPAPTTRTRPEEREVDNRPRPTARDELDRMPSRRRSRPIAKQGMSTSTLVLLLGGGGFVAFFLIIGLMFLSRSRGPNNVPVARKPGFNNPIAVAPKIQMPPPPIDPAPRIERKVPPGANIVMTYTVDLAADQSDFRNVDLKAGNRYEFYVKAKVPNNGDIDLYVIDKDRKDLASDDAPAADAFVDLVAPYAGSYQLEVSNAGQFQNQATITVVDVGPNAPNVAKKKGVNPPPMEPKITIPGKNILNQVDTLPDNGPRDPVMNQTFKSFNVAMAAGKTYEIRHDSMAFDAFLRLENPQGQQVATDDDSGGGLNSRIVYRCLASGTHRIIATKLSGQAGPFTLTVNEQ